MLAPKRLSGETRHLIADTADWVALGIAAPLADATTLAARARALEPDLTADADEPTRLLISLHARLADMIHVYRDCRILSRHIVTGNTLATEAAELAAQKTRPVFHLDPGMAIWSGISAATAILALCAFWIITGWTHGGTAVMMTAIFMCFFASMDDPAKAIQGFAVATLGAVPIAALYLFAILPRLDGFAMLALTLAPFLLIAGVLMAMPRYTARALAVILGAVGSLALQESYRADFTSFANGAIALIGGVLTASIITRLIRSVGSEFSARRILRHVWRDLARTALSTRIPDKSAWIRRMVDRVALLGPRLAGLGDAELRINDTLGELRIGMNLIDLRHINRRANPEIGPSLDRLLAALAAHFRAMAQDSTHTVPPQLRPRIMRAIAETQRLPPSASQRDGLLALVGLQRTLFPQIDPVHVKAA